MHDIILCQRCAKTIISDELETHECSPETIDVQEIGLDYWFKGDVDEHGDEVLIGKGLNGILYNFVTCKHNPPHPNTDPTVFDSDKNRRRLYRTRFWVLLPLRLFSFCSARLVKKALSNIYSVK